MSDDLEQEIRLVQTPGVEEQPWDIRTRVKQQGNEFTFQTTQDVEPYLDANREARDAYQKFGKDKPFVAAASIPIAAYKLLMTELGIPHERMYRLTEEERQRRNRLLETPEWSALKTFPGKIFT